MIPIYNYFSYYKSEGCNFLFSQNFVKQDAVHYGGCSMEAIPNLKINN